jgi:hypothetical protein
MFTIVKAAGFTRVLSVNGIEFRRFKFFDPDTREVVFTYNTPYISVRGNDDLIEFVLTGEVKRKNVLNLAIKEAFLFKEAKQLHGEMIYAFYIPTTMVRYKDKGYSEKDMGDSIYIYHDIEITLNGRIKDDQEMKDYTIKLEEITDVRPSPQGLKISALIKELEALGMYKVDEHSSFLKELLHFYNLVPKKK